MPTNSEATTIGQDVYGLLSIGGIEVALPLSTLREVVPCPTSFEPMPVKASGFLGAMELRGCIVPVLDIRSTIGAAENDSENQIIVVMTNGIHIMGLLADELRSVQHIAADQLMEIEARNGSLIFEQSFLHPDSHNIVSVISLDAVLDMPDIPLVADVTARTTQLIDSAQLLTGGPSNKYTMVAVGAHTFAFNIDQVHTTIPDVSVNASILRSSLCRGVTSFAGKEVAVLDPLALFGLGTLPEDLVGPGMVLETKDGYVILALSALLELREVSDSAITALPPFAVQRPDMFLGMSETDNGLCLFFDGEALMNDPEILSHSAVNTLTEGADEEVIDSTAALNQALHGEAQLTFSIGFEAATPLGQIEEILPFPAVTTPTNSEPYVLGVMSHRDKVIPVLCLSTLLGREKISVTDQSCLLLVGEAENQVALAVDGLKAIDSLAWTDPDTGRRPIASIREFDEVIQRAPLIQVAGQGRLLPQIDLAHVVSLLVEPTLEDLDEAIAGLSESEVVSSS